MRRILCCRIRFWAYVISASAILLMFYQLMFALFHDPTEEFRDTPLRPTKRNLSSNLTIIDTHALNVDERAIVALSSNLSGVENQFSVPRIIHQSWNDYNVPIMTTNWIKRWKQTNPGFKYMFWTDKTSRAFMAKYFPDYLALYDGFVLPVQRADLFRYFVLFSIGGFYADIDVEPLRSLEDYRQEHACVLSQEPEEHIRILHPEFGTQDNNYTLTCNAFMFCRPRHPFMAFVIKEIVERRKTHPTCILPETLLCTGPYILSVSWVKYKKQLESSIMQHPENDVVCPSYDYFMPKWDPLRTGWLRAVCIVKKNYDKLIPYTKQLCERLKANGFKNQLSKISYTDHHWFHSWTDERVRYLSRSYSKVHISELVPDLVYGGDYI